MPLRLVLMRHDQDPQVYLCRRELHRCTAHVRSSVTGASILRARIAFCHALMSRIDDALDNHRTNRACGPAESPSHRHPGPSNARETGAQALVDVLVFDARARLALTVAHKARSRPAASPRLLDQHKAGDWAAAARPAALIESKISSLSAPKPQLRPAANRMPVIVKRASLTSLD